MLLALLASSGFAAYQPATVDPPVPRPPVKHCTVQLMQHRGFAGFAPQTAPYVPPARCRGPWNRIVLDVETSVRGVQYDRIGEMWIGRNEILRFSTAEPTLRGIHYRIEKDLTPYAALFRSPGTLMVDLGNVVNMTYTGVFYLTVNVTFYQAAQGYPPADTADLIEPIDDEMSELPIDQSGDLLYRLHLPLNIEHARLDLYATNHGCDEFWYMNQPDAYAAAHKSDGLCGGGAYREIDVRIDGRLANVVYPFPYIWTGGINPLLWRPLSSIHALNVPPYEVDLDPWAGVLSDGKPHTIELKVYNDRGSWPLDGNLLLWTDPAAVHTGGAVTVDTIAPNPTFTQWQHAGTNGGTFAFRARRTYRVRGYVDTPRGRVWHEIRSTMHFSNRQVLSVQTGEQDAFQQLQGTAVSQGFRVDWSFPLSVRSFSLSGKTSSPYLFVISAQVMQGRHIRGARGACDETVRGSAVLKRLPPRVDKVEHGETSEENSCSGTFGSFAIYKRSVDGYNLLKN